MTAHPPSPLAALPPLPGLPGWLTARMPESPENAAFLCGAGFALLEGLLADPEAAVPQALLANRLALSASAATSALEGRLAQEGEIRDAFHLTPPGEAPGPDGDLLVFWRAALKIRLGSRGWQAELADLVGPGLGPNLEGWLATALDQLKTQGPLTACAGIMRAVLIADDRAEGVACLMSDVVLARALRRSQLLPLTALHLAKRDLRALEGTGPGADLALSRAIFRSVRGAIELSQDLSRRAEALRRVAPKLRSKASDAAVELFLSEDAVAPSGVLSPRIRGTSIAMTDRAARRFCDRLVSLGVARELTGRPTFRLYGILP